MATTPPRRRHSPQTRSSSLSSPSAQPGIHDTTPEVSPNGETSSYNGNSADRQVYNSFSIDDQHVHGIDHDANGVAGYQRPRRTGRPTRRQEDTSVPANKLTTLDVIALMLNKMVGTGIFTTPAAVLVLTESKQVSMVLWLIGGVYSYICLLIYLEFTSAFHYNGGELIYLARTYRFMPLLVTILFSGYFIALANTAGNAIAFAKHILIAATRQTDLNDDTMLVRFVASSALTVVCFLHMTASDLARFLNKAFAYFKILLLLVVACRGFTASTEAAKQDWSGQSNFKSSMAALVLVFYTFEGWENATYVAGELKALTNDHVRDKRKLRLGAFAAVVLVTLLYMLATAGYFCVLTYDEIKDHADRGGDLSMAIQFSQKAFNDTFGIAICIALSAVGNMIAVVYTYSRVKQAIAVQNFLPFSNLLKQNKENPIGGIILHWAVTVATIIAIPNSADGYSFVLGIFPYGHTILAIFTGLGFGWINTSVDASEKRRYQDGWKADIGLWNRGFNRWTIASIFIVLNMVVVIWAPQSTNGQPDGIPRSLCPAVFGAVEAGSVAYWAVLRLMSTKTFYDWFRFGVKICTPDDGESYTDKLESELDGSRRRVFVQVS